MHCTSKDNEKGGVARKQFLTIMMMLVMEDDVRPCPKECEVIIIIVSFTEVMMMAICEDDDEKPCPQGM